MHMSASRARNERVKVFGLELPVPERVALTAGSVVMVLVVLHVGVMVYKEWQSNKNILKSFDSNGLEIAMHSSEVPVSVEALHVGAIGLRAATYADSCILVERIGGPKGSVLIRGQHPDKARALNARARPVEHDRVLLAGMTFSGFDSRQPLQRGSCRLPHAGDPKVSWVDRNGCLVKSRRQWSDGCRGYQWYNSCDGSWDPTFHWEVCKH